MRKLLTVILAAGQSKRMKSSKSKVLHHILGKPLIDYVLELADSLKSDKTVLITSKNNDEEIRDEITSYPFVTEIQDPPLGTGHAVMQAEDFFDSYDDVLVLCGDVPLIKKETLFALYAEYKNKNAKAAVLTASFPNPTGYGRILKDDQGYVKGIVEEKDATEIQKLIKEINSGTYIFDSNELKTSLKKINSNNAQNEYYITDVIGILAEENKPVITHTIEDNTEIMGINNRIQLSEAVSAMQKRINNYHMGSGVTLISPESTYIEPSVKIGKDTVIHPFTVLRGNTVIGENAVVSSFNDIKDKHIRDCENI